MGGEGRGEEAPDEGEEVGFAHRSGERGEGMAGGWLLFGKGLVYAK